MTLVKLAKRLTPIRSFSNELYEEFENPNNNKRLEDFFTREHEAEIFEGGLEKRVKFRIIDRLSKDDSDDISLRKEYILEFLKFVDAYAQQSHKGQKRKTGRDYIRHPEEVTINVAKYGASWKTIAAALLHDVVEERRKKIKKGDKFKAAKEKGIFYSIGLELYDFVRQNREFREEDKEKFYVGISIMMQIIDSLTNLSRTSYLDYLRHKIFYREYKRIAGDSILSSTPEVIWFFLGRFHNIQDNFQFVLDYIRDVHTISLRGRNLEEEVQKTKRRTLNIKVPDIFTNIIDMKRLPITFRLAEYFKGTIISHEIGLAQHRPRRPEYFRKIMDQCAELRAKFLNEIEKDIRRLRRLIDKDYVNFVEHFLSNYKEMKRLTRPNKKEDIETAFNTFKRGEIEVIPQELYRKGSPFDGTLIKYAVALVEGDGNPYKEVEEGEELNRTLYKDLVLFRHNMRIFNEAYKKTGNQPTIERFSLENMAKNYELLKKRLMAA